MAYDFRDYPGLDLNTYISNELQPDEEFHELLNDAIDSLYRELQRSIKQTDYKIHNLIKSGSVAKGTALNNNSDLDCILVMNNIRDADDLRQKLPVILRELRRCLPNRIERNGHVWWINVEKMTKYALQLTMSRNGQEVEVDLLPTFGVIDVEKSNERRHLYLTMVDDTRNWEYYSAALAKLQREFVKCRRPNVKDLIRLVKHWKKRFVPQSGNLPPSYFLELLTIHAWERAGCPDRFDPRIGFKAVLKLLEDHRNLGFHWNVYYNMRVIPSSVRYVMDPANPSNNLCAKLDSWHLVEMAVRETLGKPLLRGVDVTPHWK